MALTTQDVHHIAMLARIEVDDHQIEALKGELNTLFAQIDELEQIAIEGVEPTIRSQVAVNVMRDDVEHEPLGIERALLNAPEREGSAFLVPRIVAPGGDQ